MVWGVNSLTREFSVTLKEEFCAIKVYCFCVSVVVSSAPFGFGQVTFSQVSALWVTVFVFNFCPASFLGSFSVRPLKAFC